MATKPQKRSTNQTDAWQGSAGNDSFTALAGDDTCLGSQGSSERFFNRSRSIYCPRCRKTTRTFRQARAHLSTSTARWASAEW